MKKFLWYVLLFLTASMFTFSACNNDEFSTNPNHTLAFSTDTVHMDTILAGVGTATYKLMVYNRQKESLLISSITLANAENSGFRINVDALKGSHFTDIEIRGNDSLFIFIEATLKPQNTDQPVFQKDSILFITNGIRQDVKLMAYGQDFNSLRGKVIVQDTLFSSPRPIVIYDSLVIKENARLTIGAGTRLYFHGKAGMQVYGQLVAEGTLTSPVVFRGDRTDYLFPYLLYDRLPGQWGGIRLCHSSYENSLNHADIHGGSFGIRCDSASTERKKLTLTNSIIHQVSGDALNMTLCRATVGNSQISNAGGSCVNLLGGDYEFVHCTLANYYNWSIKNGVALSFRNEKGKITYPLTMAAFRNCLISGSSNDEISGGQSDDKTVPFNYYFSYCLVNSIEEQNEQIAQVVWKKDDYFALLDNHKQRYNFQLDSLSAAINIGLREDAQKYQFDKTGISRLNDEAPDAGCYEWKPKTEQ